jgi:hypothetical protein
MPGSAGGCLPDACVHGVDGQLMPHGRPRVCSGSWQTLVVFEVQLSVNN